MNALPTLSPIGQQRRQAAGEGQMVSTISSTHMHRHSKKGMEEQNRERKMLGMKKGQTSEADDASELLMSRGPLSGRIKGFQRKTVSIRRRTKISHEHDIGTIAAIGDERPYSSDRFEQARPMRGLNISLNHLDDLIIFWLTEYGKPAGTYTRVTPVSISLFHMLSALPSLDSELHLSRPDDRRSWRPLSCPA